MDELHICAGIAYTNDKGQPIHSDICIIGTLTEEYKEFLRKNFEEFLANFNRDPESCQFFVGNPI